MYSATEELRRPPSRTFQTLYSPLNVAIVGIPRGRYYFQDYFGLNVSCVLRQLELLATLIGTPVQLIIHTNEPITQLVNAVSCVDFLKSIISHS